LYNFHLVTLGYHSHSRTHHLKYLDFYLAKLVSLKS